jgi:guanine deaminase
MLLGNGIAAVKTMLEKKLNVGIGTDGAACCDNQNMYESLRVAAYGSNAKGPDNDRWLASEEILEAATAGSARALGFGDRVGRIAKGYKADLVFVDLTHINWIPCNDPTNQLVHTEDGSAVHSVMVGGRMVVENRRPLGLDLASLAKKAEAARQRLAAANAGNKALFDRLQGLVNAFCPGLAKTPYHIDRFAGGHHAHYVR